MQAFFFHLIGYFLIFYLLHQFYYFRFYKKVELLFLKKPNLAIKKIGRNQRFLLVNFEHLIVNAWFMLALIITDYAIMAIFFITMYHSTIFFRKVTLNYSLAWWLDRFIILTGLLVINLDVFNHYIFKNFNWQLIFLFSIFFFLITFTTYILKKLYNYARKYWSRFQKVC